MNTSDKHYSIRKETPQDYAATENLVREAFWNVYRPGCTEHYVLHCLRDDSAFVPELDFVMMQGQKLIGQIVFMRAEIKSDGGKAIPVMTFGPISIHPQYQLKGYGKALLDYALAQAEQMGAGAVCIEGNLAFYGKSGFVTAAAKGIDLYGTPRGKALPYFLLKELKAGYLEGITGVYITPQGYFIDQEKAEAFDQKFPFKEKLKLPGQLFS